MRLKDDILLLEKKEPLVVVSKEEVLPQTVELNSLVNLSTAKTLGLAEMRYW